MDSIGDLPGFLSGQIPADPDYPKGESFNYYPLGELSGEKLRKCRSQFQKAIENPGAYTPSNQCTSAALDLARKCGFDVPDGIGPIDILGVPVPNFSGGEPLEFGGYNGSHPNPYHLDQQLSN